MKKHFLYFITGVLLVLANDLLAQQNSLLWEISGNDLKGSSYLYGTIHITDPRVFEFDSIVWEKINACDKFNGELDLDDAQKPDLSLMSSMMLPSGVTLEKLYKDSTHFEYVMEKLNEKLGAMANMLISLKPILILALVEQSEVMSKMESDGVMQQSRDQVLDLYLQSEARQMKKVVGGLETSREQMESLDNIVLEEQARMLYEALKSEVSDEGSMSEMVDLYLKQDLKQLKKILLETGEYNQFNESLIVSRNLRFAQRIVEQAKESPTFNAIGAAHLPGDTGVLAVLKQMGYKVKPIKFKFKSSK